MSLRVTPGIRFEPPAPDRLHERSQVALRARPLERRVQIGVVPLQHLIVGAGGQHGPNRRWRAGRARQDLRLPGQSSSQLLIYLHMIEEYARHIGHADFLREQIDGAAGE